MKRKNIFIFLIVILLFTIDSIAQKYNWSNVIQINANGQNAYSGAFLAIDGNDNKVIIGTYKYFASIQNEVIQSTFNGIYIAKIDKNDSLIWIKKIAESNSSIGCTKIAIDKSNNIIINIRFYDSTTIHGITYISNGSLDNVLLKLDESGVLLFSKHLKGSCDDGLYKIVTDSYNNILLIGSFACLLNIGDTTFVSTGVQNNAEGYIMKLDAVGNFKWIKRNINGTNIIVDLEDNIYMLGGGSPLNLNFDNIVINLPQDYTVHGFLVKYNKDGLTQWVRHFGQKNYPATLSALDLIWNGSNIIVTGNGFSNTQNVFYFQDGGGIAGSSQVDNFIIAYDTLGNFKWKKITNSVGSESFVSITKDNSSNLYFTGSNNYDIYFTTDTIITNNKDLLVLSIDSNGNDLWAKQAGGFGVENSHAISIDSKDNLYLMGATGSNPCIFDNIAIDYTQGVIFLAKLSQSPLNTKEFPLFYIKVYPNPAHTMLQIHTQDDINAQATIYNTLGIPVLLHQLNGNTNHLDISQLPSGVYYIKIHNDKQYYSQKIIIQH